jgi:hypothetical protein
MMKKTNLILIIVIISSIFILNFAGGCSEGDTGEETNELEGDCLSKGDAPCDSECNPYHNNEDKCINVGTPMCTAKVNRISGRGGTIYTECECVYKEEEEEEDDEGCETDADCLPDYGNCAKCLTSIGTCFSKEHDDCGQGPASDTEAGAAQAEATPAMHAVCADTAATCVCAKAYVDKFYGNNEWRYFQKFWCKPG